MTLHVLAYNMKRAMSILGVGGLIEAIRAWANWRAHPSLNICILSQPGPISDIKAAIECRGGLICPGTQHNGGCCRLAMEDAMAKALETNDSTAQNQESHPNQPADEPRPEKLEGKSLQVNENSLKEGEPVHSPAPPPQPSEGKPNRQKIQGKAFQVNENSVDNQGPAPLPAPPRRG